jgi:hypothetical protein
MKSIKFFIILFVYLFLVSSVANAATLFFSPSTGKFFVGSTFDISIILDTNGKSVNALAVSLAFPPDMLQIISPSLGKSVIGIWTDAPKFDNINGTISLQGGIPGGINVSNALISTLTFRVKSVGSAIVKFLDGSKVLLNDGLGTNDLFQTESATYQLKLPPPAGPAVTSETNPNQSEWYQNRTVSFSFSSGASGVEGYSFILSDDPTTIPDDINQGTKNLVTYNDVSDGIHFFHIKSLRDGIWGGITHYSVKIDSNPPADFKINISPSSHTSDREPVIQFFTTDALSGVDHYEMKIIPLSTSKPATLFAEIVSPYISSALDKGDYDVIVRAYDKAHNYREVTQRLFTTNVIFNFIVDSGVRFGDTVMPWPWVWIILTLILGGAGYGGYRVRRWHHGIHFAHKEKKLPESVAVQLEELKKYRAKYGGKILIIIFGILSLLSIHSARPAFAQSAPLSPPVISTISKNISDKEIFYLGGKTDFSGETVVIYLQNLETGATLSETAESDNKGDWFYRHSGFLSPGTYRLWVQGKIGEGLSAPGPQTDMTVMRTAIQFGSNRLNYETIYLFIILIMLFAILGLFVFMGFHYYHGRKKHKLFRKEVMEAEESIRRGFAVLRRDIQAELDYERKTRPKKSFTPEEKAKEKQTLKDLEAIEKHIGKEVWDIWGIEHTD